MLKRLPLFIIATVLLLSAGCASILLTGASSGIEYTLTNIAYKTVGYPLSEVQSAMHGALERMGIKELSLRKTERKVEIASETVGLKIYIDLEWISNSTTKITVDARKNIILKDKATATAIIERTEISLKGRPGMAPVTPPEAPPAAAASSGSTRTVSAGAYHTVALRGDGTVVAWGDNSLGQSAVPQGLGAVIAVSAGAYHTVALKGDGTIVGWGDNSMGQQNVPTGLRNLIALAAGYDHTVALRKDGTVAAWGNNSYGQTGVPAGLNDVIAIATGYDHSLALRRDGTLAAWGDDSAGQSAVPDGLRNVVSVAAGWVHSVALKNDGTVIAWGANNYGQTAVPADLRDVVAIAAGAYYTIALKRDGSIRAWGDNTLGQLVFPEGLHNVKAISAGAAHTVALKNNGTVMVAGDNTYGQAAVPSLTVDIYPEQAADAGAKWSENEGAAWNGSGTSVLVAPGNYTITFKSIPGWNTPAEQTVAAGRKQLVLSGTYKIPLTAGVAGSGRGTITADTKGVACSADYCDGAAEYGTVAVMDAVAGEGSEFSNWSGCDVTRGTRCLVTMDAPKKITASFSLTRYVLTVKTAGAGKGTLSTATSGVACLESSCSGTLDSGKSALIEAHALEGSRFLGWAGCDSEEGTRCTVVMNAAKTVTAVFTVAR